jgi:hypothetical protein
LRRARRTSVLRLSANWLMIDGFDAPLLVREKSANVGVRWVGQVLRMPRIDEEHAMPHKLNSAISVIGIDIGKNSFHVVGHDKRGAIMLRQKWSRGQVEARLANLPPCLIGMEACVGAHHLSRHGGVEVYDISNNQLTGAAPLGAVGLDWQFSGIGNFSGAGQSDMLLRNSNTGGLEVYDIANNQITNAAFIGTVE